jgi:hypothetical protein
VDGSGERYLYWKKEIGTLLKKKTEGRAKSFSLHFLGHYSAEAAAIGIVDRFRYFSGTRERQTIEQRIVSIHEQKGLLMRSALNCMLAGSDSKGLSSIISHQETPRLLCSTGGYESLPIRLLTSSTFERSRLCEYPPRQSSTRFGNVSPPRLPPGVSTTCDAY